MSATNVASTMVALMVNNPLAPTLDLTSLRVLSCGGSPQSPAGAPALAAAALHRHEPPGASSACSQLPPPAHLQWSCVPSPCLAASSSCPTA